MKRDLYSDVTARILQAMEAGVTMPWEKAWKASACMPMNAVTDRPYSGINVLLFWLSADCGYARPRYLTFNQAKAAGGNVRKGEHGTKVYFFKQLTVADKASGEDKQIPMLREYTVFNVSQCENLPREISEGEFIAPLNQDQRESLADRFIASTGADFREGTGVPCYVPSKDFISMPAYSAFKSRDDFYTTPFMSSRIGPAQSIALTVTLAAGLERKPMRRRKWLPRSAQRSSMPNLALNVSSATRLTWRIGLNC
jgi:antirestriction protein ArdC